MYNIRLDLTKDPKDYSAFSFAKESCRQEVSDLRQKLEELQLQRVRAQQVPS